MYNKRTGDRVFVREEQQFGKDKAKLRWFSVVNVIVYAVIILMIMFMLMILL